MARTLREQVEQSRLGSLATVVGSHNFIHRGTDGLSPCWRLMGRLWKVHLCLVLKRRTVVGHVAIFIAVRFSGCQRRHDCKGCKGIVLGIFVAQFIRGHLQRRQLRFVNSWRSCVVCLGTQISVSTTTAETCARET